LIPRFSAQTAGLVIHAQRAQDAMLAEVATGTVQRHQTPITRL
jgi:hypothetical protein